VAGNCLYDAGNEGTLTYVQDPSVSCDSGGSVGIAFPLPVSSVQFGMAESTGSSVSPLATVQLYNNSGTPFASPTFNSSIVDPFAEGLFSYSSTITNITITPSNGNLWAIDNLTVTFNPISQTPVPPSVLLTLIGFACLSVFFAASRKLRFEN
jgi:hypothetical protein